MGNLIGANPFFEDDDDEESYAPKSSDPVEIANPMLDDDDETYGEHDASKVVASESPASEEFALPDLDPSDVSRPKIEMPDLPALTKYFADEEQIVTMRSDEFDEDAPVEEIHNYEGETQVYIDGELSTAEVIEEGSEPPHEYPVVELSSSLEDIINQLETPPELNEFAEEESHDVYDRAANSAFAFMNSDDDDDDDAERFNLDAVVTRAIREGASDIHIIPNDYVYFTVLNDIKKIVSFGEIDSDKTLLLSQKIISHQLQKKFNEDFELDTSYVVKSGPHMGRRLRLSISKLNGLGEVALTFRVISDTIPSMDQLSIPQQIRDWVNMPKGLILVNGPTGSGKSTTLASLMQEINYTKPKKIITLENPIEYIYPKNGKALITQREIGKDAKSFSAALDSAMRQAPNIILVGEVRNSVEVEALLRAADTGHLSISTMHTNSAPSTINRIRSLYSGEEQMRILNNLADFLRGMSNQVLLKTLDGKGRFAVREVLTVNRTVADFVKNGDTDGIRGYQEDIKATMDHELVRAVKARKATLLEARGESADPFYFDELMNAKAF